MSMRRRTRRNPHADMTPNQESMWYHAQALAAKARLLRWGLAAILEDESVSAVEIEVCAEIIPQVLAYTQEAESVRRAVRKSQDEAEDAVEAELKTGGNIQ